MGADIFWYPLQGLIWVKRYGFLKVIWAMHSSCWWCTKRAIDYLDGLLCWVDCVIPLLDAMVGCHLAGWEGCQSGIVGTTPSHPDKMVSNTEWSRWWGSCCILQWGPCRVVWVSSWDKPKPCYLLTWPCRHEVMDTCLTNHFCLLLYVYQPLQLWPK